MICQCRKAATRFLLVRSHIPLHFWNFLAAFTFSVNDGLPQRAVIERKTRTGVNKMFKKSNPLIFATMLGLGALMSVSGGASAAALLDRTLKVRHLVIRGHVGLSFWGYGFRVSLNSVSNSSGGR